MYQFQISNNSQTKIKRLSFKHKLKIKYVIMFKTASEIVMTNLEEFNPYSRLLLYKTYLVSDLKCKISLCVCL